jgi:endo-1,4-beta-xylanase
MNKSLRIATLIFPPVLLALAQASGPQASWLDPDRSEPAGTHYRTFSSRLAGAEVSYLIYLPPTYATDPAQRYPVVYWLHDLDGNQRSGIPFVEQLNAGVRTGKVPAMIAVLVNGMRNSYYCDSPDGKWPVESVIVKELIPHIDNTYRTFARREMRAVEGYAMGGFGAAHLGFKYPDVFGIVGVMAGALAEPRAGVEPAVFQKMFGSDKTYLASNHPFTLIRKDADAIRGKTAIRVAVGDQDGLQSRSQTLHDLLGGLKIPHEYEVVPGVGRNLGQFYGALGERAFLYYQKVPP